MKKLIYILTTLFFSNVFGQQSVQKNRFLLEEITIISPESDDVFVGYILIEDNLIKKVSRKKPRIKKGTNIISLKGKYIIPGLIDNHVHISAVNGLTDKDVNDNPKIVNEFKKQLPKSYLYFGYTTLIDLSTPSLKAINDFNKSPIKPDLYHVGSGAVIGKGYGITNWNDSLPNFIDIKSHEKDHTVKAVVSRIKKSGAIGVKTYYEPGFDPNVEKFPVPTPQIMDELYKESHTNGLLLLVHANSIESHGFISQHKVDVMAHGLWRWGNLSLNKGNKVPKKIANILDLEIKNNIAYTPTLQVINGLKAMAEDNYLEDFQLKKVLPSSILDWYKMNQDKLYSEVFGGAPKDVILKSFNRINKQGQASLNYIYINKGTVLFGTDTPSSLTYGNPPGYNGYLEMQQMHEAGLSLKDILISATLNNAKTFKLDRKHGTIEKGKIANLVILDKNPLKTIEAYDNIDSIIINGDIIKRKKLKAN